MSPGSVQRPIYVPFKSGQTALLGVEGPRCNAGLQQSVQRDQKGGPRRMNNPSNNDSLALLGLYVAIAGLILAAIAVGLAL